MNRSKDINYQNANKYDSLTDEEKEKLEKTANPVIVEILDKYGKNGDVDMLKEYFNNILNKDNENLQSCKVPDVYYYLARNESLSKATYKAMKKYAKNEEDMPKTCADYKKTIWDKIVAFFNKNKKKIKQLSSRNKRTVKNKAKTRSSLRGKNILKQLGKVKDNVKDMAAEFRDKLRRSAAKQGKNQTYNAYENGSKAWKLHNMDEFDTSDAVEGVFREWGHDDSVTYADDGDKKEEEL
jgi:hypothetical protein